MGNFFELVAPVISELADNLLLNRLPQSSSVLNISVLYVTTILNETNLVPTNIFAYNGKIDGDDAFIAVKQDRIKIDNRTLWTFSAPEFAAEDDISNISDALESMIDWESSNSFTVAQNDISWTVVHKICQKYVIVREWGPCLHYYMDKKFANEIDLNLRSEDNIVVKDFLDNHDIKKLLKYWEHAGDGAFEEILFCSTVIGASGVTINNELVSWAFGSTDGLIHGLYTLQGHRNKGYAKIVLQSLAKTLTRKGLYPTTQVLRTNAASQKLMTDTGFKECHQIYAIEKE